MRAWEWDSSVIVQGLASCTMLCFSMKFASHARIEGQTWVGVKIEVPFWAKRDQNFDNHPLLNAPSPRPSSPINVARCKVAMRAPRTLEPKL